MRRLALLFLLCLPLVGHAERFAITLSEAEKATINEVVGALGEKNDMVFMQNAGALMPKVMSLLEISPFQIMGYILTQEELKGIFMETSKNPMRWNMFVQGFQFRMEQELMMGNVDRHLSGFAEYLSLDVSEMENFISDHAWNDFVLHALNNGRG